MTKSIENLCTVDGQKVFVMEFPSPTKGGMDGGELVILTSKSMLIFNVSLWDTAHLLIISLGHDIWRFGSHGCDHNNFITSSEIMWLSLNYYHYSYYSIFAGILATVATAAVVVACRFTQFIIHMREMLLQLECRNDLNMKWIRCHSWQHDERWPGNDADDKQWNQMPAVI